MRDLNTLVEEIRKTLPWAPLGSFPTPLERFAGSGEAEIWVKRDDLTSPLYGGNKVRKLEFLLADARAKGAGKILTFGGVGSNHAVACAAHGSEAGLSCEAIVVDQPLTPHVRKNLLLGHSFGARLHYASSLPGALVQFASLRRRLGKETGKAPYVILPGGSTPLGSVGYALAALELAEQVGRGELPKPDAVFVALGSSGTLGGLLAGAALAGISSEWVGVQVVEWPVVSAWNVRRLAEGTLRLLKASGKRLPPFQIEKGFFGGKYGLPTQKGAAAIERASASGLALEGTYTGKTFAALLDWAAREENRGKRVLFWNTYSGADQTKRLEKADWRNLPQDLWKYFDESVEMVKPEEE
ncbi:MAG: pyridoxal-phosphate dependent enzyme [Bdellovibrionota bacterium]